MTAFDTDIFSDMAKRVPGMVARAATIPAAEQCLPVVAAEEPIRGQLAAVRRAEAGAGKTSLPDAYRYFENVLLAVRTMRILPYTPVADALARGWRAQGVRIGTRDLRIAAIAFAHGATLATRNARDFAQVPGLTLDVWS